MVLLTRAVSILANPRVLLGNRLMRQLDDEFPGLSAQLVQSA
jgi:hypothetical protein